MTSTAADRWERWNASGGPRYPHANVVQYCFRQFPERASRAALRALDLGCGGGVHTLFLAREGFNTVACDVSQTGVDTTRARLADADVSAEVHRCGIDELTLAARSIDLVLCVGVLECCGPAPGARGLDLLAPALTPDARGLFVLAAADDCRVTDGTDYGLHGYTRDEVAALFESRFPSVWIDDYITTYRGGRHRQHDWLITLGD